MNFKIQLDKKSKAWEKYEILSQMWDKLDQSKKDKYNSKAIEMKKELKYFVLEHQKVPENEVSPYIQSNKNINELETDSHNETNVLVYVPNYSYIKDVYENISITSGVYKNLDEAVNSLFNVVSENESFDFDLFYDQTHGETYKNDQDEIYNVTQEELEEMNNDSNKWTNHLRKCINEPESGKEKYNKLFKYCKMFGYTFGNSSVGKLWNIKINQFNLT